jgi:hypothetical protein
MVILAGEPQRLASLNEIDREVFDARLVCFRIERNPVNTYEHAAGVTFRAPRPDRINNVSGGDQERVSHFGGGCWHANKKTSGDLLRFIYLTITVRRKDEKQAALYNSARPLRDSVPPIVPISQSSIRT